MCGRPADRLTALAYRQKSHAHAIQHVARLVAAETWAASVPVSQSLR